ncbi:MAG: UDP-N-acetylglucosamine--N-acetylmuramyl-(pentapeptide) pyrophosphoryl-undecaprenol N-acetylglucosamine transferase, partial [Clostridiales bacterium]|nr:UDP-N-acetylglucosamine--N-acetylmuramyl-(pentapeptide) pyrophosphoryl-undecaprenol N-acetylglucosamine transferase [Clostridiales bacterium]
RPDIVIGTGGYVCGPVVKVAGEMGIKAFIHEQNAFPGLTNKMLEKHVEKIFTGFEEAGPRFKNQGKVVFTGNPVRKGFYCSDKHAARARLGVPDNCFAVLSFGGSQGAGKMNEVVSEAAAVFSGVEGIALFFATGRRHYDAVISGFAERGVELGENIRVLPYLDEMDQLMAASDIVISRAGALAISEIAVCGKPAILVPSPNVVGNHQYFNARAVSDRGSALLIEEREFSAEKLISALLEMKSDRGVLEAMEAAVGQSAKCRAVEIIYDNLGIDRQ